MKTIYIVAGGPIDQLPDLKAWPAPSLWVGVDRGISSMLSQGIKPNVVFGDFDSVEPSDLDIIKQEDFVVFQYPSEKDDTDLGLAFHWALSKEPETIIIFGNTGGRMDHTMGGIQLLLSHKVLSLFPRTEVRIVDQSNSMTARAAGSYTIRKQQRYKYISFLPMSPVVEGLTLSGFKYPLADKDIALGSTLCISNELISENGHFSFRTGILLVISSTDQDT